MQDERDAVVKIDKENMNRRRRAISLADDTDATFDFEIVEATDRRHGRRETKEITMSDWAVRRE